MRLSSKTRYAARTLARLASAQGTDALSARQLAECRDLSVKYPEHILRGLNSAGVRQSGAWNRRWIRACEATGASHAQGPVRGVPGAVGSRGVRITSHLITHSRRLR
jgi:hypothetical protein